MHLSGICQMLEIPVILTAEVAMEGELFGLSAAGCQSKNPSFGYLRHGVLSSKRFRSKTIEDSPVLDNRIQLFIDVSVPHDVHQRLALSRSTARICK